MRINLNGVYFRYHGDTMLWRWPWLRKNVGKYWSSRFGSDFYDLANYWQHVGVVETALSRSYNKVNGHSMLEVLSFWATVTYPLENLVVLTNVDVSAKGVSFWARLPKEKVEDLMQDIVVLRCKDRAEVFRLISSTPTSFADAYGFAGGKLVGTNSDVEGT